MQGNGDARLPAGLREARPTPSLLAIAQNGGSSSSGGGVTVVAGLN